jgi:hypothetical protein
VAEPLISRAAPPTCGEICIQIELTDCVVAVDYGTSLPDMIAAGKYDWVDDAIMPDHFPVDGTGTNKFRTKLFDFDRSIS